MQFNVHFECCLRNNSTFVCKNDLTIFINLIVKFTPPSQILFSRAELSKEQLSQSSFYANLLYATGMVWHTIFHHVFMFTSIKNAGNGGGMDVFVPLFRSFCVGPALSQETIHNHTFSFFYLWPPTKNLSLPRNETGTCNYRLRERKNKKKTNQKMSKSYSTIFFHFIHTPVL